VSPPSTSTKSSPGDTPNAADEGAPAPEDPSVVRLKLDPYSGPKSHHASRAFAEYQSKVRKGRSRRKMGYLFVALVVGSILVIVAFTALR
jgi:hypothetical protein